SVVRVGQKADLIIQELPNEHFVGNVTRTAASIDQNTRTLLIEVQVRNHKGLLLPGMYAQVNLIQSKSVPPVLIPGEAIVVRDGKSVVALVQDQTVHFRPVTIGRDYGNETEITNGLQPGDVVALNVSDEVRNDGKIDPDFGKQTEQQPGGQSDKQPNTEGQYGNQNQSNQSAQQSSGGKKK
ncbi:MAG: efflux RND transporter periplasmic adaptor subunit, partial [Acidobacteriota bacterium]|nr:efflux RND transporter periplasmic adaptor subunit [Acidobacteriota bacterium]